MILGIDMGGTNTRIGLVDEAMRLIGTCSIIPSSSFAEAQEPMDAFWDQIQSYMIRVGVRPDEIRLISVGVPASVCADLRTIFCAPNLKDAAGRLIFEKYPFADLLEQRSHIPVLVNKDVNNLLCYDIHANSLEGIVAGCYIGTGVGGAVSIDGEILLGRDGVAMDIGHLPLFHGHKHCGCGKRGCAETEIAGVSFLRLVGRCYPGEDPATVFLQHCGDPVIEGYVRDCAHVPAILATVFNPSAMVLGGGVLEMDNFPRQMLEAEIITAAANAVSDNPPRFVYADRLPERGIIGAALFAKTREVA